MSDSNIQDLEAFFARFDEAIDFTRPGTEGSLGKDLLKSQGLRILDRAQAEQGSEGEWAENRGEYKKRKDKKGLPVGRGLGEDDENRMLSQLNVMGEQEVTATEATMRFGQGDKARNKGDWFTNGSEGEDGKRSGAKNQPPRPFYQITSEDEDAIIEQSAEAVGEWLQSL